MKCLIDADVLMYEIGACGQFYEPEDVSRENLIIRDFDSVAELLDQRVKEIVAECWSDEEPVMYLTGDEKLFKMADRKANVINFKPNFRIEAAKSKVYKGQRKQEKPYHYHNLRAYTLAKYNTIVTNGIEADDAICIELYKNFKSGREDVIACTRDKDLRMVPGWHYGWPCGKQEAFGPRRVTELGDLKLSDNRKSIKGTGIKFFYAQLITGDNVDNIGGLPKGGPVLAAKLAEFDDEASCFEFVLNLYEERCGSDWETYLQEQSDLLWMVRELDAEGVPIRWRMPVSQDREDS